MKDLTGKRQITMRRSSLRMFQDEEGDLTTHLT